VEISCAAVKSTKRQATKRKLLKSAIFDQNLQREKYIKDEKRSKASEAVICTQHTLFQKSRMGTKAKAQTEERKETNKLN
jgi:hypothetical protein